MNKCDCYHTRTKTTYLDPASIAYITGKWPKNNGVIKEDVGECWGTKERDACSCGGDRARCDFYPEMKEKANREEKK